jgi:hypothetical protein
MSDADLPKSWEGAVRWFIGGTIVFASGFEAVVLFWEGKLTVAASSLFVAIVLMGILLNWDWLKAKMLRRTIKPFKAWRYVSELRLRQAACLLADIEPNDPRSSALGRRGFCRGESLVSSACSGVGGE